jgi:nitroreductase
MTVTATSGSTASRKAHTATLLNADDAIDRAELALLRSEPDVVVIDRLDAMQQELSALRPGPAQTLLDEPRQWAWYPWRRTLISVPGPRQYRRLRLDRNRNKITTDEQDLFGRLTIGVVGLSVGHSIAHTLALEGLCGRLRLADNDTIELSNLNRIPATVFDLGINKATVVARRIAELDPHLPTDVFTSGLTEECMDEFFDGLDLVIEECDSLDMKVRVREEARARRIPVFMETSDRGLFDVERFDAEPDRVLFHGLLGDVDPTSLRGLSTHAKAPHVMRILQTADLSPRMAASMVEIDRTVSTWPQLGGDVQLGGATVAAAVRRFGRGEPLPSGRIRIDLEHALDGLGGGFDDGTGPATAPIDVDLTEHVPATPLDAIVHAIALAPSGGNSQPWAVDVTAARIDIYLAQRSSAMDVAYRGSYVAIGAGVFNARVAAARHGMHASIAEFPQGPGSDPVASIELGAGAEPALAELYPAMIKRITNRNVGRRRELAPDLVSLLRSEARAAGARLWLITEPARIAAIADILAESDRVRFLTPLLHEQMMGELRWPGPDRPATGIDVDSLGLDASDLAKLEVSRRPDVMRTLASWGVGAALGDNTRDRVIASSAVAVLTVRGDTPNHYLRGGAAVEQLWIRADQHQLGVHPVSPAFLYARSESDFTGLSAEFSADLQALQCRFNHVVGLDDSAAPVLVLRLSHDAPPPRVRSQRLDRGAVVSSRNGRKEHGGESG